MLIKVKSIYKPKDKEDGTRILITRFYPRGVRKDHFDQWMRELAPSKDLLKDYKTGEINQSQFTRQFLKQIHVDNESKLAIQTLSALACDRNVTLLCYERDGDFCHRHLVQDVIKNQMAKQELCV